MGSRLGLDTVSTQTLEAPVEELEDDDDSVVGHCYCRVCQQPYAAAQPIFAFCGWVRLPKGPLKPLKLRDQTCVVCNDLVRGPTIECTVCGTVYIIS